MKKDIFDYKDYKAYLRAVISSRPKGGRGVRLALSRAISCPVSHISQVLSGRSHLSMEQAEGINTFLGHTHEEANFFFLLLQLARAGSTQLRQRLELQIQKILEKRLVLRERLGIKAGLSLENQATFYSSWLYGTVHVMLSIKEFQTKDAISQYLGLSMQSVGEILDFLCATGLAKQNGGRFDIGTERIHLGTDSPMISKFHTNWRIQAIRSLEKEFLAQDLHYSSAITVSEADAMRIKNLIVKTIEEIKATIRQTEPTGAYCFSTDFFKLRRI